LAEVGRRRGLAAVGVSLDAGILEEVDVRCWGLAEGVVRGDCY